MNFPAVSLAVAVLIGGGDLAAPAAAQGFPSKPLRYIVPFPPGGGADVIARLVGQKAAASLGQQIVIDNRGGAGGNIAAEIVAKSPPDGYTLLQSGIALAVSPSMGRVNFNLLKDFVPVTRLASIPFILVVNPGVPGSSVKELIAFAKSRPGQLNYGSTGGGGSSHLAMELLKSMAGLDIRHVPYKGAGQAATDLFSGQIQMMFIALSAALPHVNAGKLKGLAIASGQRVSAAPDYPTVAEAGLPGFEMTPWYGVMVSAGTPSPIVSRLHAAFVAGLNAPDVRERLTKDGFELAGSTSAEFAIYVRTEVTKWAKVVKASGASDD